MSAPRLIVPPGGGGTVTGTGTPGTLAKWTAATTVGDSGISDDGATVSFVARDLASTASSTTWTLGNPNAFALIVKSNSGPQRTLVLDTLSRAVGVGGTPGTLLHVQDNAGYPFAGSTYEGVRLQRSTEAIFSASDYTLSFRAGLTGSTAVVGTSTAHDLLLQRGNVTALTLGASGAVTFAGNLTSSAAQTWTLAAGTSALNIASNLLNLDTANSRVGIGTTSPSAKLEIPFTSTLAGLRVQLGAAPKNNYHNAEMHYFRSVSDFNRAAVDTVNNYLDVSFTSGWGIKLPATPGNADAQTLDAYSEIGTGSPAAVTVTLSPASGTITLSGSANKIRVTRIGNCVYGSGYLAVSAVSSPTGRLSFALTGCPQAWINFPCTATFATTNAIPAGSMWTAGSDTANPPTIYLDRYDGTSQLLDMAQYIKAGTSIDISFVYQAA